MKVVQIVPGSGGTFYCQNCLRDGHLVRGLRGLGHEITVVPMYLPDQSGDADLSPDSPVFYGAVRMYLGEKLSLFRHLPGWAERLLDSRGLLDWAARRAGSTGADGLADMTLSVLAGENGRQAEELEKLVAWLRENERPDVVHLSNSLLLGLAGRIRAELGVPVVCSLQDEDFWVDAMNDDDSKRVWRAMGERAADVDAFVAVSRYYADRMAAQLELDPGKVHAVPVGIPLDGCEPAEEPPSPPAIGYLSRMSESLGLGLLVDAYLQLRKDPALAGLKLRATGGQVGDDLPFVRGLRARLAAEGAADDAEFPSEFDRDSRIEFLRSLSVLSVPVPGGEAFGMHGVEALAVGVPVVLPRAGAFGELIEATGGGLLCEPGDVSSLTEALRELLLDPARARDMGAQGRGAVQARFSTESAAREMTAFYESVTG